MFEAGATSGGAVSGGTCRAPLTDQSNLSRCRRLWERGGSFCFVHFMIYAKLFATYSDQETCLRFSVYYNKLVVNGFMVAINWHPAKIIKGLLVLLLYYYKINGSVKVKQLAYSLP